VSLPPYADVHLVLCSFGRDGLPYAEADPAELDASTIVHNSSVRTIRASLRVVAMNVGEGWSRDVSDVMADKVREVAQREDMELTDGTLAFLEAHEPEVNRRCCRCGEAFPSCGAVPSMVATAHRGRCQF
jgi:hypothetical protein